MYHLYITNLSISNSDKPFSSNVVLEFQQRFQVGHNS